MPLVRFSLMETQFFRQDSFSNFFILTFCFRRVVRYNPMVGPEMEEEVERLFYTPTPARFSLLLLISSSFNLSIRSPHTLLFAFGGWSRTGSGDAATFGPSSDIMIFNPATRFKAKCHPFSHRHTRSWSKMEQDLPQPVAYTAAAGFNNQTTEDDSVFIQWWTEMCSCAAAPGKESSSVATSGFSSLLTHRLVS